MTLLKGKVIAITGAASGIGKGTAEICHAQGATLSLADRNEKALLEVVAELNARNADGQSVVHRVLDVCDTESVDAWIANVVQTFGCLNGAANVAGVTTPRNQSILIKDMTDADWHSTMDINSTGMFKCVRAELRAMKDGAAVVNVASLSGMVGGRGMGPYTASKHSNVGLTKTAAKEAGADNIRVNCVCPGFIDTPMLNNADPQFQGSQQALDMFVPMRRKGQPQEVGSLIAFLLSDNASYVNGGIFTIDGGMLA